MMYNQATLIYVCKNLKLITIIPIVRENAEYKKYNCHPPIRYPN